MRVLNSKDLEKVAGPKDYERLTAKQEPKADPQLKALEDLAQSITDMQAKQSSLFADMLTALLDKGDQEKIEKQISVLERLEKTITSSMNAYSNQIAEVLTDMKSDTKQSDATDRLTKAVAMMTAQKSEESAEAFSKMNALIDKLEEMSERRPVVNVDNPVTVEMPEPAKKFDIDVKRSPQGLITHAVVKREQ